MGNNDFKVVKYETRQDFFAGNPTDADTPVEVTTGTKTENGEDRAFIQFDFDIDLSIK